MIEKIFWAVQCSGSSSSTQVGACSVSASIFPAVLLDYLKVKLHYKTFYTWSVVRAAECMVRASSLGCMCAQ